LPSVAACSAIVMPRPGEDGSDRNPNRVDDSSAPDVNSGP
jgi:hypothetical protein